MTNKQPEALRLADMCMAGHSYDVDLFACATELRSSNAYIVELEKENSYLNDACAELEALIVTTQQGIEAEIQQAVEAERERICAAIKAEDDHCVDQGDYMLDSNDCIKIVRGKWARPDYSVDAAQAKQ